MPRENLYNSEYLESMPASALTEALKKKKLTSQEIQELELLLANLKGGEKSTAKPTPERKGNTKALIAAIEQGDMVTFLSLINRNNVNTPDENGTTPLIAAVKKKDPIMLQHILDLNPNLNAEDSQHKTAQHYAVDNIGISTILQFYQKSKK